MTTANAFAPRLHRSADFPLASGAVLPELVQSHVVLGTLNAAGDNAVIVLHGLTTGPSMLNPEAFAAEGAWCDLVGPGRAIDTDRFFVVCPNALGSSYGTTGPGSIDARTGKPHGTTFPDITVGDMIQAQKRLLDRAVKKGDLSKSREAGPFPKPKTCYAAPGYDFQRSREAHIEEMRRLAAVPPGRKLLPAAARN